MVNQKCHLSWKCAWIALKMWGSKRSSRQKHDYTILFVIPSSCTRPMLQPKWLFSNRPGKKNCRINLASWLVMLNLDKCVFSKWYSLLSSINLGRNFSLAKKLRVQDCNFYLLLSQCIRKLRDKRSNFMILVFRPVYRKKLRLKKVRGLRSRSD